METTTHVLNDDMKPYCGNAVIGDRAITLEQARDTTNEMFFDCEACYKILSGAE